jgi:micrococcal nuclease
MTDEPLPPTPPAHNWVYKATFLKNYDGDTIDVTADLGFDTHLDMRLRLLGIDTPELTSADPNLRLKAQQARDFARQLLTGQPLIIETVKDAKEKYGRYLARIWARGICLNDELVRLSLATPYSGGARTT